LIDRYKRLGRMPAAQHEKVKARIEQVMSVIKPVSRKTDSALPAAPIAAPSGDLTQLVPAATSTSANESRAIDQVIADEQAIAEFEEDLELADDFSEDSITREFGGTPASAPANAAAASVCAPPAAPAPSQPAPSKAAPLRAVARESMATRVLPPSMLLEPASLETRVLSQTRLMPPATPTGVPINAPAPPPIAVLANCASTPIGVGTVLHDRYELRQLLGRGGIATVYKAVDRYRVNLGLEDCYVAVKIVQPHPSRPGSVAALGREFHNAQLLSHPNVINVFNIDHAGDASFYTMELLDGERLSQVVKRIGVLPRPQALAIIRDIGAAIAHAHSRGVVHADLKLHNVMITRIGQVRVLDFGSGMIRTREPWISEMSPDDSYRQATPAYASCEQLEGWSADPRDDIYALACLAYMLLTGKHPFNMQPSLDARAQQMQPRRPAGLKAEAWRALRRGLGWTREQRTMSVEDWLLQMGVSDAVEALPPLALLHAGKPYNAWIHRAAAAGVIIAGLGLAAFTVEHQDQFDWHQAQDRLSDAWRGLQSLADSPDNAAPAAQAAALAAPPAALPPAPATAPAQRKNSASRASHGSRGSAVIDTASADTIPSETAAPEKVALVESAPSSAVSSTASVSSVNAYVQDPANGANPPKLEFSAPTYVVPGTEPAARIVIRRNGNADGDLNFVWWTEEASARADVDYASLGRRIERIPSGSDKITVYVPIISTPLRHEITQFYVALGEPGSLHSSGPGTRSLVTIDHGS
jgi:serine/threonine protein kinase